MLKAAIDRILELSEPTVKLIGSERYSDRPLHRLNKELTASPLQVHTLSAVLDYITSGADEPCEDDESIHRRFVVHVADYDRVYLYRELNSDKARECLLEAEIAVPAFPFGRWMDVETFIINAQTHFVQSDSRDALLKLISTVTADDGVTMADDGISQRVTAKTGVSLVSKVNVPNPVELAPFRSFGEIEQPESPFVFRVKKDGDQIFAALFAADGDGWKRDAILTIRDWFAMELPEENCDEVIILA